MAIEKRAFVIIAIAAIMIIAVIAAVIRTTRPVTATAILRLERPAEMPIEEFDAYRNSQRRMILSEYVLSEAAEDPLVARTRFISRQKDPAKALADRLKDNSTQGSSELIVLTFQCSDGDEAITILDEIIDEYLSTIVVEARVQREGLLSGVKEKHKQITGNYERLKKVRAVLAELSSSHPDDVNGQKIRLEDCRHELEIKKSRLDDTARIEQIEQIEQTIRYIDQRVSRVMNKPTPEDLFVDTEVEKLDRHLERYQIRIGQIASDIAEWESHATPEIKVIQHAKLVTDRN